ncbi:hypothetical protein [Staphylococcus shinii]|uniref:hypothetical protein n=1 Tax=Staphylococcus shinii TaxID=2912228 RepID=UPI00298F1621|nr:hypothetical protein [Staphylococcus shinii]MDW8564695.1 hypothetical protein [Staphylococcus shinii]
MNALIKQLRSEGVEFEVELTSDEKYLVECKDCTITQYNDGVYFVRVGAFGMAVSNVLTVVNFVKAYHDLCEDNENLVIGSWLTGGYVNG